MADNNEKVEQILCPKCGEIIDSNVEKCPHCGCDIQQKKANFVKEEVKTNKKKNKEIGKKEKRKRNKNFRGRNHL